MSAAAAATTRPLLTLLMRACGSASCLPPCPPSLPPTGSPAPSVACIPDNLTAQLLHHSRANHRAMQKSTRVFAVLTFDGWNMLADNERGVHEGMGALASSASPTVLAIAIMSVFRTVHRGRPPAAPPPLLDQCSSTIAKMETLSANAPLHQAKEGRVCSEQRPLPRCADAARRSKPPTPDAQLLPGLVFALLHFSNDNTFSAHTVFKDHIEGQHIREDASAVLDTSSPPHTVPHSSGAASLSVGTRMLPISDLQSVGNSGQGSAPGHPYGPRVGIRGVASAPRAAIAAHNGFIGSARSRPLPVGSAARSGVGARGSSSSSGATAAGASSGALATTPSSSSCLSRQVVDFGYDKDVEARYEFGRELGKGGNGVVRAVVDRATGEEFACKAIRKVLPADASDKKRAGHVESIRREVEVMRRLAGSLAAVRLVDVFEDDDSVYIIQELCRGGELHHRIGSRHYSERTVASFMRAVLRTIAQCHSQHILHRDIKVGLGDRGDGWSRASPLAKSSPVTAVFPPSLTLPHPQTQPAPQPAARQLYAA
jgi:hypothetical protein